MIAANYIVATAMNVCLWGNEGFGSISKLGIGLGMITGVVFVISFLLMMICMGRIGVAVTVSLTRLAVVLPVGASIVFYGERLGCVQFGGMLFAAGAFLLLGKAAAKEEIEGKRKLWDWLLLGGLFMCMGLNGVNLKVFEEHCDANQMHGFLAVLFATAGSVAWFFVIWRRENILWADFWRGLVLGVPNCLSSVFFLLALRSIAGVMAFPVNDVAVVVMSTLAAIIIWGEKPNRYGWAAVGLAVVAIILMNITPGT